MYRRTSDGRCGSGVLSLENFLSLSLSPSHFLSDMLRLKMASPPIKKPLFKHLSRAPQTGTTYLSCTQLYASTDIYATNCRRGVTSVASPTRDQSLSILMDGS